MLRLIKREEEENQYSFRDHTLLYIEKFLVYDIDEKKQRSFERIQGNLLT